MTRTRRIYNKVRKSMWRAVWNRYEDGTVERYSFYHPYLQLCCGNCSWCKKHYHTADTKKREDRHRRRECERTLRMEAKNI